MPITDPPTGVFALPGVYYIDYMSTIDSVPTGPPVPDFGTLPYYCARPENLTADDTIGGVGNCAWEWSFSALDCEGNPILRAPDFIHPERSWYRLRCGSDAIMAGPVVSTNAKLGDQFVKVAGQSWEGYFGKWQYPFDPRPSHVNDYSYSHCFIGNEDPGHAYNTSGSGTPTPTGLSYQCQNRDIALIARDLLIMIRDGVPDRLAFNYANLEDPVGITTNFQYTLGDDSTIDSTLTNLTGIGEGFDYWMGQDLAIRIGSPYRFGSTLAPVIAYFLDINTPGLLELEYQNLGIAGNHVLGRGDGLAVQTQMGSAYGYAASQDTFSRLDISFDYGDVRNQTELDNLTKKSLSLGINPVRNVPVTIDPGVFDAELGVGSYWPTFRKGVAIYITVDTLFHPIDAPYQLKKWDLKDNENTGNMQVDLTLSRIYPQVADFGNPDL